MRPARKVATSSALFVAWCAPVFLLSPETAITLWALAGAALMTAIVLNDLERRIIPFWMCALMAALGALKQLALSGVAAAAETLAVAAGVTLLAFIARRMLIELGGARNAIGGGDCAAVGAVTGYLWIPATAQAPMVAGLLTACIAAITILGIALVTKTCSRGELVPFGPFFYVWALVGTWATAFAATSTVF